VHNVEIIKKSNGEDSNRRRLTRQVSMHTLNGFNELRLNVKLCDASLILDNGDTFPIHRSVLSGSSDYFRSVPENPLDMFLKLYTLTTEDV